MGPLHTVTDPSSFFEEHSEDLSLLPAVGVVALVAALNAVSGWFVIQHTMSGLPADTQQQIATIMYASSIGGAFVGTAIFWVLITAVFHFLSTLVYEGEGSFGDTLAATGWGYLPQAFTATVSIVVLYYAFFVQGITPPELSSMQAFQQYSRSLRTLPAFQLTSVVGIAGTLWSGYVWIGGVTSIQQIDESDAFIVVAIPVTISVLWTLFNLL